MSEEQEWHFISVVDEQQYGPYNADQLQEFALGGAITRQTLVWTEALDDWIPAANVEGLFPEPAVAHRPKLLTGAEAQAARPLGASTPVAPAPAPAAAPHPQQQLYQQPVQAAVPQQQVRPGMIPSTMPGTMPAAAPAAAAVQPAGYPAPAAAPNPLAPQVVPPGELYPSPGTMKASFGMLLTFLGLSIVAWVGSILLAGGRILAFVSSGGGSDADAGEALGQSLALVLSGMLLSMVLLILYRIFTLVYLYRAWKSLQPGNVRMTPGKAVGFLFIPFFGLYWLFVAHIRLAKDWNRVMASHPNLVHAPRINEGLVTTYCITFVVFLLFFFLLFLSNDPELAGGPIGIITLLLCLSALVLELIVYFLICRAVNFMGKLHLTTIQAQQPAMGLRLY